VREGIRVREITNEEGEPLLQIERRSSGSVVRWRRAQIVLLSAQGMEVAQIAKVAFTSQDRVRAVLRNFNDDGFDSLAPTHSGVAPRRSLCRSAGRSRRFNRLATMGRHPMGTLGPGGKERDQG